jgi:hypothetical protein
MPSHAALPAITHWHAFATTLGCPRPSHCTEHTPPPRNFLQHRASRLLARLFVMHCNIAPHLTKYYRKKRDKAEYGVVVFPYRLPSAAPAPAKSKALRAQACCQTGCRNLATACVQVLAPPCGHFLSIQFANCVSRSPVSLRMLRRGNYLHDSERSFDSSQCLADLLIAHRYVSSMKHLALSTRKRPSAAVTSFLDLLFLDIGGMVTIVLPPWPIGRRSRRCTLCDLGCGCCICGKSATTRAPDDEAPITTRRSALAQKRSIMVGTALAWTLSAASAQQP